MQKTKKNEHFNIAKHFAITQISQWGPFTFQVMWRITGAWITVHRTIILPVLGVEIGLS
jgi:hypothetical protein